MISGCLAFVLIFGVLLSPFMVLEYIITGQELHFDWISTPIIIIMFGFYIFIFYAVFFGKYNNKSNNRIEKSDNGEENIYFKNIKKKPKEEQTYKAKNNNSFIE